MSTPAATEGAEAGSDPRYPRYEREARLLTVHPMRIVDDLINAVNDHTCNTIDAVEAFLLQDESLSATEESRERVKQSCDGILQILQGDIDKSMDKLEVRHYTRAHTCTRTRCISFILLIIIRFLAPFFVMFFFFFLVFLVTMVGIDAFPCMFR